MKYILSRFLSMFSDGIKSEQPDNTFTDAIGWTVVKGSEKSLYVSSINGNEVFISFPEGFDIRGDIYIPEHNMYVFLGINKDNIGEVGVAYEDRKVYRKIVDDNELDRPLGLNRNIYVEDLVVNIFANCNRIQIYFQTNMVFRVIELFDPCRDFSNTLLMKTTCMGSLSVEAHDGLGMLVNGMYSATLKIYDKDGNDTNFNLPSHMVSVADLDYRLDQETRYGLLIEGSNMPKDYNYAEIVIVENISGAYAYKIIPDVFYSDGYLSYVYTGKEGYYAENKNVDINNRYQRYFEGDGLTTHDSALFLKNVKPQRNFNLQRYVNKYKVRYKRWLVPIEDAEHYNGLRNDENYAPVIWFNGIDGTTTIAYNLMNDMPEPQGVVKPGEPGNCQTCDVPIWATQDTSEREELLFDYKAQDLSVYFRENFYNKIDITPVIEVNRNSKIETIDNPTSFLCNGTCEEAACGTVGGCNGASCGGSSCGNAQNTSDGLLPRTTAYQEDNPPVPGPSGGNDYQDICNIYNCETTLIKAFYINVIQGIYDLINTLREYFELDPLDAPEMPNCTCSTVDGIKTFMNNKGDIMKTWENNKSFAAIDKVPTSLECTSPGEIKCVGDTCMECIGGKWHYVNNAVLFKDVPPAFSKGSGQPASGEGVSARTITTSMEVNMVPTWGANCLKRKQPIPYSTGKFGYWETNNKYPDTIGRDDCLPIYREWAGKNEVLFKVPSLSKEEHFFSLQEGVPSKQDIGNIETQNTYVIFTGFVVKDIVIPTELKDWICKVNPFTIGYAKRDENNKTVYSTGLLHGVFAGQIQGEEFLFPKHAVNSFEFYDANINPGGNNSLRRGYSTPIPAYIYHSPDYHLYGNKRKADYLIFQLEMTGKGYRHGHYADGKPPHSAIEPRINMIGTRQGINMNHYTAPKYVIRCIKGMTDALFNKIIGKDSGLNFSRSLVNLYRESSQYIELENAAGNNEPCVCPECADLGSVTIFQNSCLITSVNWSVAFDNAVTSFEFTVRDSNGEILYSDYGSGAYWPNFQMNTEEKPEHNHYISIKVTNANGCEYDANMWINTVGSDIDARLCNKSANAKLRKITIKEDCDCENNPPPSTGAGNTKLGFSRGPDGEYGSINGGLGDNNESDNSFIGDTIVHESFIKNSRAHLVTAMRYVPNQYGPVIGRMYDPLLIEGAMQQPNGTWSIEGMKGDSFINHFTYKRSGFVSDKVPEDITPPINIFGASFPKDDAEDSMFLRVLQVFQRMTEKIFAIIGFEQIGTTPNSGDRSDQRNLQGGLRNGWNGMEDENTPIGPPSVGEYPDTFVPMMVKTYISTVLPSDANLAYRGTGSIVFGEDGVAEVHRGRLKTLNLDSTMPDGFEIFRAWINRIYGEWMEPARWKMIFRVVANFMFTYGIGLWIIITGISIISFDTSSILSIIGTVLSIIAAVFLIGIGIAWIILWAGIDLDNKVIDSLLNIDLARPDKVLRRRGAPGGLGSRFAMYHDRIKQLEDNYWYYNPVYSTTNDVSPNSGIPFFYDTQYCPTEFTNRVIASNRQIPTSEVDAFRQFKPNHYLDLPRTRGQVKKLISFMNNLYAQTTDTMYQISYRGETERMMTNEEISLGRLYLFGRSVEFYAGIPEGGSGTKDPNASMASKYGYFSVDRDARRINVFRGINKIEMRGIEEFMDDNIKFHLLDYFPDFNIIDQKTDNGVHFDFGIDHGNDMVYVYKRDFVPLPEMKNNLTWNKKSFLYNGETPVVLGDTRYFENRSFLYLYSVRRGQWISREYLRPGIFLQNRYNLYTVLKNKMYTHDTKIFNSFYGVDYPYFIEVPLTDKESHNAFTVRNIKVIGDVIVHLDGGQFKRERDIPVFQEFMIYNGHQNTGWIKIRDVAINDENDLTRDTDQTREITWESKTNGIVIEDFRNNDINENVLDSYNMNLDILDNKISSYPDNGTIMDDFVVIRLLGRHTKNTEIHLRKIIVSIAPTND